MTARIPDDVAGEVGRRLEADGRVDVLRSEQATEAGIAARFVWEQVRAGVVRGGAARRALGAVDADADEVGEGLPGGRRDLSCLRRTGPEHRRDVDRRVLENRIGRAHGSKVTAGPCKRRPGRGGDLPVFVDHLRRKVGLTGPTRIEQRRRPVGKRHTGPRGARGREVAKAVRHGLPHPVGVDAGERAQDPRGGVRDEDGVVVREQRAVLADKVQQVRHLFEVRGHVRVVAGEVHIVKLDVDHMLDLAVRRGELASRRPRASGGRQRARRHPDQSQPDHERRRECRRALHRVLPR